MKKNFVSNSTTSIRMFKSNFLEQLSKVSFYVPLIVYLPVIVFLFWKSIWQHNMPVLHFSWWFVLGLGIWTITEYLLHRYVFHFEPEAEWGKKIHFIFHGVHHDYPNDAKRLVMPPSASIPLALGFYFLFYWLLSSPIVYPFFSGFIVGYLFYDMVHYALHHANFKSRFWKKLKQHHMLHHYADSTKGYGVSWTFWDHIFRSNFDRK